MAAFGLGRNDIMDVKDQSRKCDRCIIASFGRSKGFLDKLGMTPGFTRCELIREYGLCFY